MRFAFCKKLETMELAEQSCAAFRRHSRSRVIRCRTRRAVVSFSAYLRVYSEFERPINPVLLVPAEVSPNVPS
jgi:hypothetical protein